MTYIQRNTETGAIMGSYAQLQPGYAEEHIDDNAEELLQFLGVIPRPLTLAELKAQKRAQIDADRDALIVAGVAFGGAVFDSDERSRSNLTGAVAAFSAGVPMPEGFAWRSADNVNVPMNLQALVGLAAAMLVHVNTAYAVSWQRKAAVEAAETAEAVEAA